jgi:hypothetical protein
MATINVNGQEISVEQLQDQWALALMSQGVIVKLNISRWRAQMSLSKELLGIKSIDDDSSDFMNKYINLGRHKLLPPPVLAELNVLERRSRDLLDAYSFRTVWGHFVPFTAFEEWERQNSVLRDDFMAQARALGNNYDSIVATVKNDYRNLARDVWQRLYPESDSPPTGSFVENFVSNIIDKIPSSGDIVASFKYNVTYFIIPMPSFVEENISKAEEIRREAQMADFNDEMERETKRRIAEEYITRKKELIDGFLESTVSTMRQYVRDLCDSVLQSISKKAETTKVTTRHVNKLKGMIKKVRFLNFYDDEEITELINSLETELEKIKGERDDGVIVDKLKEISDTGKKKFIPKRFNPAISVLEV